MMHSENHAYIFIGPSGPVPLQVIKHEQITILPPVKRGDIIKIAIHNPSIIAIVDGYFGHVASVSHKEIMAAISKGITIVGSSSMGALRACELRNVGMIGVGEIYEDYVNEFVVGDDEVAVLHADHEYDYQLMTFAVVELRKTLESASHLGAIPVDIIAPIVDLARSLALQDRNQPMLLDLLSTSTALMPYEKVIESIIQDQWIFQKRIDALLLCEYVLNELKLRKPLNTPNYTISTVVNQRTSWQMYHSLKYRELDGESISTFDFYAIVKLFDKSYINTHFETLKDVLVSQVLSSIPNSIQSNSSDVLKQPAFTSSSYRNYAHDSETLDLINLRIRAKRFRQLFYSEHDNVEKLDAEKVCLLALRYGINVFGKNGEIQDVLLRDKDSISETEILSLRTAWGGLPLHYLVAAARNTYTYKENVELTRQVLGVNDRLRHINTNFDPQLIDTRSVLSHFLKNSSIDANALPDAIVAKGFIDLEDFIYSLKLSFVYRISREYGSANDTQFYFGS